MKIIILLAVMMKMRGRKHEEIKSLAVLTQILTIMIVALMAVAQATVMMIAATIVVVLPICRTLSWKAVLSTLWQCLMTAIMSGKLPPSIHLFLPFLSGMTLLHTNLDLFLDLPERFSFCLQVQ